MDLALFPLSITVLPEESVALHIFEPKYRQLLSDYKDGEKEFGIVYIQDGKLSKYGTSVYVEQLVNEYPDGTSDIIVKGNRIFRLEDFHSKYKDRLYAGGQVSLKSMDAESPAPLLSLFQDYLEQVGKFSSNNQLPSLFQIANRLQLSHEQKNEMIGLSTGKDISRFLMNECRFLIKIKEQEELLNRRFHLN